MKQRLVLAAGALVLAGFAAQQGVELFVAWYSGVEPSIPAMQWHWLVAGAAVHGLAAALLVAAVLLPA